MKFSFKTTLAAVLFSAVPIALAQDAATDVKKGADATGHETKVVAKDTAKGTEKVADKTGHETKVVAKDTAKGTEKVAKKTGSAVKTGAKDTRSRKSAAATSLPTNLPTPRNHSNAGSVPVLKGHVRVQRGPFSFA